MRFTALSLIVAALLAGSCPPVWAAYYGQQARPGTFGVRTFGQTLAPHESQFGGGVQRNASGQFLGVGRPDARMFTAPWQRSNSAFVPAYIVPLNLDLPLPSAPQLAPPSNVQPMPIEQPAFTPAPMMPAPAIDTPTGAAPLE